MKLGILTSHPIQYQAPLFRELAQKCDLKVYFAHRQTSKAQAEAGFGVPFDWDIDLLKGYDHHFLRNVADSPHASRFFGCDTPEIIGHIRRESFDAFLNSGWHLKCYWQAVRICHETNTPIMIRGDSQLVTQRSLVKRVVKRLLYPWVIRQFDMCLYVGQRNKEYLRHYGADPARLMFAPHCIDTHAFADAARESAPHVTRQAWQLSPSSKAALFVGKLVDRKRPEDLVQAAARLRSCGMDVTIVWAGDGPARTRLEQLGHALQVPSRFLGFRNQTQLPSIYAAADVLVLPSDGSETWGLVVNESLACGTPCVVSDACGSAPDLIRPGATGACFVMGDVSGLADSIRRALSIPRNNSDMVQVSHDFSVAATASAILQAVRQLHAQRKSTDL